MSQSQYQNDIKNEEPNPDHMILEDYFANNHSSNQEFKMNYDLAPLTPNYFENNQNQELMNQESNNLLIKLNESDNSNNDIEKKKLEDIEFFDTNCNQKQQIFSRGGSDENKIANYRHLEFLNKKQEFLEVMTNEVKEKIKNSQILMQDQSIDK